MPDRLFINYESTIIPTTFKLFILAPQYLTTPPSQPVTSHMSLRLQVMTRTGLSCACQLCSFRNSCTKPTCVMVSKPNVEPFHIVISPLCPAVSTRRPSGVHCNNT